MTLTSLLLKNFRLFSEINLKFSDKINIITGKNGQGKTSILESIYFLSLVQSFRANNDKHCLNYDNDYFEILGDFVSAEGYRKKIRVYYSAREGKHIFEDNLRISRFSTHIGKIPCVVLTLNDLSLSFGSPAMRRKFADVLLSQVSPAYLQSLKSYKKVLMQRNALLGNTKDILNLQSWDKQLVEYGSAIISKRLELNNFLNKYLSEYYIRFSGKSEEIKVEYRSTLGKEIESADKKELENLFYKKLKKMVKLETEKQTTITGPHRDDYEFFKDNKLFKDFGSQGENKTLIIVLKLLEWKYLSMNNPKKPVLLLDDIFGELDISRMEALLSFLPDVGQTFITTALQNKFPSDLVQNVIKI